MDMNRLLVFGMMMIAGLSIVSAQSSVADIEIVDPWVREAPPNARSMAAYMTLINSGNEEVDVVAVFAMGFGSVMVHKTVIEKGIARMNHQAVIKIAPKQQLEFSPGGTHIMLMKPEQSYQSGDTIRICLKLSDGSLIEADFPVRRQ